jgi:hypothetical protein
MKLLLAEKDGQVNRYHRVAGDAEKFHLPTTPITLNSMEQR